MTKIKICTNCGFTWDEFLSRRIFGCSQCYTTFSRELRIYLAEFHGNIKHLPLSRPGISNDDHIKKMGKLAQFRELLSKAVQQEKFEEALRIKKQISRLESGNGSH